MPRAARAAVNSAKASGRPACSRPREFSSGSRAPTPGHPTPRGREGSSRGAEDRGGGRQGKRRQRGRGHLRSPSRRGPRPPGCALSRRRRGAPGLLARCRAASAEPRAPADAFGSTYSGLIDPAARVSARGAGLRPPRQAPYAARSRLRPGPRRLGSPACGRGGGARVRVQRRLGRLPASRSSAPRRAPSRVPLPAAPPGTRGPAALRSATLAAARAGSI